MSARHTKGMSIVEIVVAAAILMTLVTAIGGGWQLYIKVTRSGTHFTTASNLSEEGAEALQLMRDLGWSTHISPLSLSTEYDLYWNSTSYIATTTPTRIQDVYRRTVTFSAVARDAWDNIVSSGGTVDTDTRQATLRIYLISATTSEMIHESYTLIHNTYDN